MKMSNKVFAIIFVLFISNVIFFKLYLDNRENSITSDQTADYYLEIRSSFENCTRLYGKSDKLQNEIVKDIYHGLNIYERELWASMKNNSGDKISQEYYSLTKVKEKTIAYCLSVTKETEKPDMLLMNLRDEISSDLQRLWNSIPEIEEYIWERSTAAY